MSTVRPIDIEGIATRLDRAWERRESIPPLSESEGLTSPTDAYAIQSRWAEMRLARGERVLGRKIGLTSIAMQQQIGVDEPDYGQLWESRYFPADSAKSIIPAELFVQPRVEAEIAFRIGEAIDSAEATTETVLAATDALAVSVEVIDSRIHDWRIALVDTIADNASFGAYTHGPWNADLLRADLRTLGMLVQRNGDTVVEAIGASVLGHPAYAVAWLARTLSALGTDLSPGDVVLSGSVGRSLPVRRGDEIVVETFGQPPLTVVFE